MWACTNCGEQIEDQFDVCWNCGVERKGTARLDQAGFWKLRPTCGFLVILLIASLAILFVAIQPQKRTNQLGRRYLKELEGHFAWLQSAGNLDRNNEGIDPAFSIAI